MDSNEIIGRMKNIQNPKDLLNLLNDIKLSLIGENAHPFTLRQLMRLCNPNINGKAYSIFYIPKKNGGYREILSPRGNLKLFQCCLLEVFTSLYTPAICAKGYVRGRNLIESALPHIGKNYVFQIDLQDFFTSIDQARVWKRLQLPPFNFSNKIASIIAGLCCIKYSRETQFLEENECYCLPQGAPTSPILSNAICDSLDRKLSGLAKRFRISYTRYADDITFSSNHYIYQNEGVFIKELHRIISSCNFKINPTKTRLSTLNNRQLVCGIVVNKKLNLKRQEIKDIRAVLHIWEKYGLNSATNSFFRFQRIKFNSVKDKSTYFQQIIEGKLNFLRNVRGDDEKVAVLYSKFKKLKSISKSKTSCSGKQRHPFRINPYGTNRLKESSMMLTFPLTTLCKFTDSPYNEFVRRHKIQEFVQSADLAAGSNVYFMTDSELTADVKVSMERDGLRYESDVHMPIVLVTEVPSKTETTIEINGKYYQPIGLMPASRANTSGSEHLVLLRKFGSSNGEGQILISNEEGVIKSTMYGFPHGNAPEGTVGNADKEQINDVLENSMTEDERRTISGKPHSEKIKSKVWKSYRDKFIKKLKLVAKKEENRKSRDRNDVMYERDTLKGTRNMVVFTPGVHEYVSPYSGKTVEQEANEGNELVNYNSRTRGFHRNLGNFFGEIKELIGDIGFNKGIISSPGKKAVIKINDILNRRLNRYIYIASEAWRYDFHPIDTGTDIIYELNLYNEGSKEVIPLTSISEEEMLNITEEKLYQVADEAIKNVLFEKDEDGKYKVRMLDSKYAFAKWQFERSNVTTANSENMNSKAIQAAQIDLEEMVDDGLMQVQFSDINYSPTYISLNNPISPAQNSPAPTVANTDNATSPDTTAPRVAGETVADTIIEEQSEENKKECKIAEFKSDETPEIDPILGVAIDEAIIERRIGKAAVEAAKRLDEKPKNPALSWEVAKQWVEEFGFTEEQWETMDNDEREKAIKCCK